MTKLDTHVCLFDPAIKWGDDATNRDTWPHTREPEKLVLKDGAKAMVFHTLKLGWPQYEWVTDAASEVGICGRAFRVGVRRVTMPSGESWAPVGVDEKGFFAMSPEEMERFENEVIVEIGALIVQSSKLPFGLKGSYKRRPSSQHVMDAHDLNLRCAELNRAIATKTRREPVQAP